MTNETALTAAQLEVATKFFDKLEGLADIYHEHLVKDPSPAAQVGAFRTLRDTIQENWECTSIQAANYVRIVIAIVSRKHADAPVYSKEDLATIFDLAFGGC